VNEEAYDAARRRRIDPPSLPFPAPPSRQIRFRLKEVK
jgi:hypothetical protein